MKSPTEVSRTFIDAMGADRADRNRHAFDVLIPAAMGGAIYNSEFTAAKATLDRSFEEAWKALKDHHRPSTGYWADDKTITPWGQITHALGYISGVRGAVAESKKLAKMKIDHPLVGQLRALCAVAIPVHEMLEAIKKQVIKGKRPAAVSSKQKRIAGRVGGSGTCQICGGSQAIVRSMIALHGYNRPGVGFIIGECYGAKHPPFEVSCDRLRSWIGRLDKMLTEAHDELAELPFRKTFDLAVLQYKDGRIVYSYGKPVYKHEPIGPDHPFFEREKKVAIVQTESRIRQLITEIAIQKKRLAGWAPV